MNRFFPEGILYERADNKEKISSAEGLKEAEAKKTILEGRVSLCDFNHNLFVDLPAMKGIIPREEGAIGIKEGTVRDIALISRVSHPVCFTVTGVTVGSDGRPLAVLSRRNAQQLCMDNYIESLSCGDIIDAKITHLEPFGAFCDIGCGIVSLMSIDCISVSRIFHPADRFSVGQSIKAIIKSREPDGKINLSHKELLGTWEQNAAFFQNGQTVSGIIRTVESYGSFVELTPNLAGLAEPKSDAVPGAQASVFIKNILPDKMKIKLIIVDCFSADYSPKPLHYFIDGGHISRWNYSPKSSPKEIFSSFD